MKAVVLYFCLGLSLSAIARQETLSVKVSGQDHDILLNLPNDVEEYRTKGLVLSESFSGDLVPCSGVHAVEGSFLTPADCFNPTASIPVVIIFDESGVPQVASVLKVKTSAQVSNMRIVEIDLTNKKLVSEEQHASDFIPVENSFPMFMDPTPARVEGFRLDVSKSNKKVHEFSFSSTSCFVWYNQAKLFMDERGVEKNKSMVIFPSVRGPHSIIVAGCDKPLDITGYQGASVYLTKGDNAGELLSILDSEKVDKLLLESARKGIKEPQYEKYDAATARVLTLLDKPATPVDLDKPLANQKWIFSSGLSVFSILQQGGKPLNIQSTVRNVLQSDD